MVKVVEGTLPLRRTENMLVLEGDMGQGTQLVHMQHLYKQTPMEVCFHPASAYAFAT